MISETTTITAAAASTRMACRWEERVKAEATRNAMATTKSPAAALSESKPISSTLGAAKNPPIRLYSTRFESARRSYIADSRKRYCADDRPTYLPGSEDKQYRRPANEKLTG